MSVVKPFPGMSYPVNPLFFHPIKTELDKQIIKDLELPMIYAKLTQATTPTREKMAEEMARFTTTDTHYLRKVQKLLKNMRNWEWKYSDGKMESTWNNIQKETSFEKKYLYLDFWHQWNRDPHFLQIMSIYHILSPLLSLIFPILLLIFPFLILMIQGIQISVSEYIKVLSEIAQHHAIGRIFQPGADTLQDKAMIGLSLAFYIFSIYQNIRVCLNFYHNYQDICNYLQQTQTYLRETLDKINLLNSVGKIHSIGYRRYLQQLHSQLTLYLTRLQDADNCPTYYSGIGKKMSCFYEFSPTIHNHSSVSQTMKESFLFHAYWDNFHAFSTQNLGKARFSDKNNKKNVRCQTIHKNVKFQGIWYPAYINAEKGVTNNVNIKHIILTGPNASGKTTLLKTLFINSLLTQQFGYGCYQSAHFPKLYSHFYCYINIPDTSGRDSLFQAEARRCKEMLDKISQQPATENHLCVLDELYSGTNPVEATQSAYAFMSYLINQKNVSSILTTHFTDICEKIPQAQLKQMKCTRPPYGGKLTYTYRIIPGISQIKGAKDILIEMNYPHEISKLL
jgi:hypothetical protein